MSKTSTEYSNDDINEHTSANVDTFDSVSERPASRSHTGRIIAIIAVVIIVCVVIVVVIVAVLGTQTYEVSQSALDDESSGDVMVDTVSLSTLGSTEVAENMPVTIAQLCPTRIDTACTPASIEIGIDCGMDWMCGIDPCLCGAPDAWGFCACNGLQEIKPEVSWVSSDENIVRVVEMFGGTFLMAAGTGDAQLTATASLAHYSNGEKAITVHVDGLTIADVLLIVLIAVIVAVIVVIIVVAVHRHRVKKRQKEKSC